MGANGGQAVAREATEEMDAMLEVLSPDGLSARQAKGAFAVVLGREGLLELLDLGAVDERDGDVAVRQRTVAGEDAGNFAADFLVNTARLHHVKYAGPEIAVAEEPAVLEFARRVEDGQFANGAAVCELRARLARGLVRAQRGAGKVVVGRADRDAAGDAAFGLLGGGGQGGGQREETQERFHDVFLRGLSAEWPLG